MKTRMATRSSAKGRGMFKTRDMISGARRPQTAAKRKAAFQGKVIESIVATKRAAGKVSPRRRLLNLRSHRKMVVVE